MKKLLNAFASHVLLSLTASGQYHYHAGDETVKAGMVVNLSEDFLIRGYDRITQ